MIKLCWMRKIQVTKELNSFLLKEPTKKTLSVLFKIVVLIANKLDIQAQLNVLLRYSKKEDKSTIVKLNNI